MSIPRNTSNQIANIMVDPVIWVITQAPDTKFRLKASFVQPERDEFFEIVTSRGQEKEYKTIQIALADINRVQRNAMVHIIWIEQLLAKITGRK